MQNILIHSRDGLDAISTFEASRFYRDKAVVILDDGSCIGSITPARLDAVDGLTAIDGVTIFPPAHVQTALHPDHAEILAHAGVTDGDTIYVALEKLKDHHQHSLFTPHNF